MNYATCKPAKRKKPHSDRHGREHKPEARSLFIVNPKSVLPASVKSSF
jgi:hypothetical protein